MLSHWPCLTQKLFLWHGSVKFLKSDSHLLKNIVLFASLKALLKMMKIACYFILRALFVLKIFKFLSWLGHVGKTA